jgi:hypothetical protein
MRSAGQGEVGDVGVSVGRPVGHGVVDLTPVAGHRAAREAAAAVCGVTVPMMHLSPRQSMQEDPGQRIAVKGSGSRLRLSGR